MLEGYLTVREVAEKAGVTMTRVRYLVLQGRFPGAVQPARDWLIPSKDVDRWLTEDRDRRYKVADAKK